MEDGPVPLDLDSPYQISKVVGEFYSVYYHRHDGLPTVRARFQNVYGPGEILGAGEWRGTAATVWRNVTPTFVYRPVRGCLPRRLECRDQARPRSAGDDGGRIARRDDCCGAGIAAGRAPGRRVMALVHHGRRFGSTEKARSELGFESRVSLDEGLRLTVDWMREHLDLIDACIERHAGKLALA